MLTLPRQKLLQLSRLTVLEKMHEVELRYKVEPWRSMAISKELLPPIVLRLIRSLRPTKNQQGPRYKTTGRERGPEYYDKVFLAGQRKHYKGRKPRISETSFMKPSLGTTLLTSNSVWHQEE